MSAKSSIEWTDATWTPIRARVKHEAAAIAHEKGYFSLVKIAANMAGHVGPHCERVSSGCGGPNDEGGCYSEANNGRCLPHNGTGLPFDRRARDLVDVFLDEKILAQPLHWKKPRRVFVCSQTDLYGEWVPDEMIDRVFAVMALCPQHTFQVLTKRGERMAKWFESLDYDKFRSSGRCWTRIYHVAGLIAIDQPVRWRQSNRDNPAYDSYPLRSACWPLPNVWLGISAEDQQRADERIPWLLKTPAAVRFVSYEPALGPIRILGELLSGEDPGQCANCGEGHGFIRCPNYGNVARTHTLRAGGTCESFTRKHFAIAWVIIGGESGTRARPFDIDWARSIIAQCKAAGVACFVKQLGAKRYDGYRHVPVRACGNGPDGSTSIPCWIKLKSLKGGDPAEWPADLRVREWPGERRTA